MSQHITFFQDDVNERHDRPCPFCGDEDLSCDHIVLALDRSFTELYGGVLSDRIEEVLDPIRIAVVLQSWTGRPFPPSRQDYLPDLLAYGLESITEKEASPAPDEPSDADVVSNTESDYADARDAAEYVLLDWDLLCDLLNAILEAMPDVESEHSHLNGGLMGTSVMRTYWAADPAEVTNAVIAEIGQRVDLVRAGGIGTVIRNAEDLHTVARLKPEEKRRGATLLSPDAWRTMSHFPFFTICSFDDEGPLLNAIALSSFGNLWPAATPALTRRLLRPHGDHYAQYIGHALPDQDGSVMDYASLVIHALLMNNAVSPSSTIWARPLCARIPAGIVFTSMGLRLERTVHAGFAWLLKHADAHLAQEIASIEQTDSPLERLRPVFYAPPLTTASESKDFQPTETFERWWQLVTAPRYQQLIYRTAGRAWYAAKGTLGTVMPDDDGTPNADFHHEWLRFAPPPGNT